MGQVYSMVMTMDEAGNKLDPVNIGELKCTACQGKLELVEGIRVNPDKPQMGILEMECRECQKNHNLMIAGIYFWSKDEKP